ncbi:MAG: hypothetical protein ABFS19_11080 [Thermodesulfobacteriota bacterium]
MDISQLIPKPDQLQVGWGWFQALLTVTFLLHLIVMNLMLGGALISFFRHAGGAKSATNGLISKKLPLTIAFTVNFGVAPLLFLQVLYGHFMYASSVMMAVFWLGIVALLIIVYYSAYLYNMQYEATRGFHTLIAGFIAGGLLGIGFILTSNMSLMVNVESWPQYFDRPEGMILNLADPVLLPRYLHSVLGAVGVAGLAMGLWYDLKKRKGDKEAEEQIGSAMTWFTGATLLNFGVGTWYMGSLPVVVRGLPGINGALLVLCLLIGITCAIFALIKGFQLQVRTSAMYLFVCLAAMVLVREFVRRITLAPWFSTSDLEVVPQYSPLVAFLLVFAAGIVLVGYMIQLVLCDREVGQ